MEKKSFIWWVVFILLFIWQLPQNLVGLIMLVYFKIFSKTRIVACRHYSIMFESPKMSGGISLGSFCFGSPNLCYYETYVMHELDGHTVDSKILGPLYLLFIGLPSILHAWLHVKCPCYYHFFTERLANYHAGLICDKYCDLRKKN